MDKKRQAALGNTQVAMQVFQVIREEEAIKARQDRIEKLIAARKAAKSPNGNQTA